MKKIIDRDKILFFDENDKEIMSIENIGADCIWYFNSNDVITITEDMELFNCLKKFMEQKYLFSESTLLKSSKEDNKLIWYSDCYYDPDNDKEIKAVSYLTIEQLDNCFKIWCTKPLDKIINRKCKNHIIGFSPLGNGIYSKNIETNKTLQDDFVSMIYQPLLNNKKRTLSLNN